jgi:hypothetical protein
VSGVDVPHQVLDADPETLRGLGGIELFFLWAINEGHRSLLSLSVDQLGEQRAKSG